MKKIPGILTQFKTVLSANIPALLTAEGLADFDTYTIGQSRNEKEKALCVYKSDSNGDDESNRLTMFFQLQLYGVDYETAEKYGQVVYDYLKDYEPNEIGMNILDNINTDSWPIEQTATTFIYIEISYIEYLDSCD